MWIELDETKFNTPLRQEQFWNNSCAMNVPDKSDPGKDEGWVPLFTFWFFSIFLRLTDELAFFSSLYKNGELCERLDDTEPLQNLCQVESQVAKIKGSRGLIAQVSFSNYLFFYFFLNHQKHKLEKIVIVWRTP